MAVNIFKNSEVIAQIYTEMGTGMFSATTPVAVIDMNVGDTAFVRTSSIHQPHGDVFSDVNVKISRLLTESVPVQLSSVAFYAQLSISEQNIGKHHPIVFDNVILNVGNGYNKHSGTFTAPSSGIYVFTFLLFPSRSGNFKASMIANISPTKSSWEHTLNTLRYADRVKELRKQVSRLQTTDISVQPSAVAFYAQLTTSEQNVGKHHPIVFDHVILNVGNGYNKHTGAFSAPISGIYVFTFTLFPNRGGAMTVNIFKNSEVIAQIYTQMRNDMFSATTPVAVIDMNVGDTAFVRTSSVHQPIGDVYSDGNVKSSFAGWKIADL
ncbi:uncharacterized protein LOC127711976 [Mytilus californianus]|uniref:uncharacterized protein LOC127711976 n=1 Tax=Mytilus californianus TaxID=6549 RepID=UPI002246A8EE|nr:uncharacterized protein LOC127711976 [Mytilus californianus]